MSVPVIVAPPIINVNPNRPRSALFANSINSTRSGSTFGCGRCRAGAASPSARSLMSVWVGIAPCGVLGYKAAGRGRRREQLERSRIDFDRWSFYADHLERLVPNQVVFRLQALRFLYREIDR